MLLSDNGIYTALQNGYIKIDPFHDEHMQPASYDIMLDRFFIPDPKSGEIVDVEDQDYPNNQFILYPGEFVLGSTIETIEIGIMYAAALHNKSSNGRKGLLVTCEANWIDPGFKGNLTMELANVSKKIIILSPRMKIGQLVFHPLQSLPRCGYNGKYQGQSGPRVSSGFQYSPIRHEGRAH